MGLDKIIELIEGYANGILGGAGPLRNEEKRDKIARSLSRTIGYTLGVVSGFPAAVIGIYIVADIWHGRLPIDQLPGYAQVIAYPLAAYGPYYIGKFFYDTLKTLWEAIKG